VLARLHRAGADWSRDGDFRIHHVTTAVCTSLDAYNSSAGIAIEACDTNKSWQKWNRDANNQRLKNLGGFTDRCITRVVPGLGLRLDSCDGANAGLQRFTSNAIFVNGNTLSLPALIRYVGPVQPGDPPQGLCWSAPNAIPLFTAAIALATCADPISLEQSWLTQQLTA
jgi:hypothetical protein